MFFKKQGKPEVGDVIICTVKNITYHSVFVNIDEYENLEGMIHISEIAPGRIRNLRDYVVEGKRIVCKVLNINKQENIDLSLRRVPTNLMVSRLNDYKQEEKAEKLLEQVGKEVGMDLKKSYEEIGFKIIEKYGSLFTFFQAIVDKGKTIIDELKPNPKLGDLLFKIVKEKIKPIEVNVSGILTLSCHSSNGIEDLKSILLKAEEHKVKVSYLGAPKYKLEVTSKNYKSAENALKNFLENATVMAKKLSCEINFVKND